MFAIRATEKAEVVVAKREKRNHFFESWILNGCHDPSCASQQKVLALRSG